MVFLYITFYKSEIGNKMSEKDEGISGADLHQTSIIIGYLAGFCFIFFFSLKYFVFGEIGIGGLIFGFFMSSIIGGFIGAIAGIFMFPFVALLLVTAKKK